jgi:hypothetical protein
MATDTEEKPKRLAIDPAVLRELFLKSGNICAFPGCKHLMIDAEGTFIGQICHIEGVGKTSARFNKDMDNKQRAAFSNLLLLCYKHHKKTDNEKKYPVPSMQKMKTDHEKIFTHPERALLATMKDQASEIEPKKATNLKRVQRVYETEYDEKMLKKELKGYSMLVDSLKEIPFKMRKLLALAVMRDYRAGDKYVLAEVMEQALNSNIHEMRTLSQVLEQYHLGGIEDEDGTGRWVFAIWDSSLKELADFCTKEELDIDSFLIDLRFDQLDE